MNKDEFYIELDDGWYSVFGTETGKCYAQFGSKRAAENYIYEREGGTL